jgi:hypothetical protein
MASVQARTQKAKTAPGPANLRAAVATARLNKEKAEPRPQSGPAINAQEREMLIARAAYFRAEKRGFVPGSELQDWVEAEAEVLRLTGVANAVQGRE